MKRKIPYFLMLILILFLTGCAANTDQFIEKETPKIVEVDIQLPETITSNHDNTFKAVITQSSIPVEDADEVMFEIWKANEKEKAVMIEASYDKNGIYKAKSSFEDDGVYFIQTHVTARDMHVMPKQQFAVGNVTEEELKTVQEASTQEKSNGTSGKHH
ncbi:FixH family protein [Bacillus sp. F19]|nr:FixH family protein [Bacillus sp. F19]